MERSNVAGVMTFHADNRLSGSWSNMLGPRGWNYEGEWQITNGDCVTKITKTSFWNYTNAVVVGQVDSMKIFRLDGQELVVGDNAQTNIWTRKK